MRPLLLSALALLAAPVFAQAVPPPLDLATLDLAAVTPTDELMDVEGVNGDTLIPLGTVTTTATLADGVLTIVTTDEVSQAGPTRVDSTRMAWPSLGPISDDFRAGEEVGTATFTADGVAGTYGRGTSVLPFEFSFDTPRLAPAALPLIARALPFEEGYAVSVATFSAKERYRDATLTVTGYEDVDLGDGTTVSAWLVRQVGGGGQAGQFPQTLYIDAETRALLKTTFDVQGMAVTIRPTSAEARAAREAEAQAAAEAARSGATNLRPGAAALDAGRLQSGDLDLLVKLVQPMAQDIGTERRELVVDEAAGTATLTTSTVIAMAGQDVQASFVAAYPSLAPISMRRDDGSTVTELAFADGRVTGTGEDGAVDQALDAPVFVSDWQPVLVTLLPLAEGYSAVLHAYSTQDGVVEVLLTVTGQDEADGRTAWLVDAAREGRPTITYRVDAETHALLGYGLAPQPGVRVEIVQAAESSRRP